jgi:hypothetical protein
MALGEAKSGSGQNLWSVLAQGLSVGASAIPGALESQRQNKLKQLGAIFDAQNQIMAKQQHEQSMALGALELQKANLGILGATRDLTTLPLTTEQKVGTLTGLFPTLPPGARMDIEGVGSVGTDRPTAPEKTATLTGTAATVDYLVQNFGKPFAQDWLMKNDKEAKGYDVDLVKAHSAYVFDFLSAERNMKVLDEKYVPKQPLTFFDWAKQSYGIDVQAKSVPTGNDPDAIGRQKYEDWDKLPANVKQVLIEQGFPD